MNIELIKSIPNIKLCCMCLKNRTIHLYSLINTSYVAVNFKRLIKKKDFALQYSIIISKQMLDKKKVMELIYQQHSM